MAVEFNRLHNLNAFDNSDTCQKTILSIQQCMIDEDLHLLHAT